MNTINPGRPAPDEYFTYYGQYINRVPEGDIVNLLTHQLETTNALLAPLSTVQVNFRPKPDDWNILEVLGHVTDAERVFAYRALCIARNDQTPLPSFDQDLYVATANFAQRPLADLLDEFALVRRATLFLLRTFDEAAWLRKGVASDNPISTRALAYIIAGHELHHLLDFQQRYNVG
ncbi:MAG: DinB family protein [Caldilineaceae bacterium]